MQPLKPPLWNHFTQLSRCPANPSALNHTSVVWSTKSSQQTIGPVMLFSNHSKAQICAAHIFAHFSRTENGIKRHLLIANTAWNQLSDINIIQPTPELLALLARKMQRNVKVYITKFSTQSKKRLTFSLTLQKNYTDSVFLLKTPFLSKCFAIRKINKQTVFLKNAYIFLKSCSCLW